MPNDKTVAELGTVDRNLVLLRTTGLLVFGERWKKLMGKKIGVSERQLVRWNQGEWPVPDTLQNGKYLPAALLELVEQHQRDVDALRAALFEVLPEGGRPGT